MNNYKNNIIQAANSIRQALESLNNLGSKANLTLFVLDQGERLIATLTDGDIRRALLSGKGMDDSVEPIMRYDFSFIEENNIDVKLIKKFRDMELELIPVLDNKKRIVKILDLSETSSILPVDAVIMAGGKGKRLGALTIDTPKPLIKIGNKTILEHGIDRLVKYGITNVHISINHHADKIKKFCGDGSAFGVDLTFVEEDKPLGTIGSVALVPDFHNDYILVMNSDLLTNINLEDMFLTMLEDNADMVVASIPYKVKVPYATLEIEANKVKSFSEKPTFIYYSNGGIYLIKKEVLNLIPSDTRFDATDLMKKVVESKKSLISFPILGYWLDIGMPEDYNKAQEDIISLKLGSN